MHTNRKDLMLGVLHGLKGTGRIVIIDNSDDQELKDFVHENTEVIKPYVPMSFSQSMNVFIQLSLRRNLDALFVAHEDIKISDRQWREMYQIVDGLKGRKWGMILTNEDSFCAYNPKVFAELKFDTRLPDYFADTDFQYWLKVKGWEIIQSPIGIYHYRSQTIESDPKKKLINSYTYPLYSLYYRAKTGGDKGQEKYRIPFDNDLMK